MHRMGHEQPPILGSLIARGAPQDRLLGRELGQKVILAIAPDRPLGSVERDQAREAHEIAESRTAGALVAASQPESANSMASTANTDA